MRSLTPETRSTPRTGDPPLRRAEGELRSSGEGDRSAPPFAHSLRQGSTTGLAFSDLLWKISILAWTVVLARTAGRESLGVTELALSLGSLFHLLSSAGVPTHAARTLAGKPAVIGEVADAALGLKLTLAFPLLVGSVGLALTTGTSSAILFCLILTGSFLFSLGEIGFSCTRGLSLFAAETRSRLVAGSVLLALAGAALATSVPPLLLGIAFLAAPTVHLLFSLATLRRLLLRSPVPRFGRQAWQLLRSTFSYGLTDLLGLLYLKSDVFLVGLLAGATELGIYAAPSRILLGFLFLPAAVTAVMLPAASRAFSRNRDEALRHAERAARFLLLVAMVVAVPCILAPRALLGFLLGDEFLDSAPVLVVLGIYLVFRFVTYPLSILLVAADRQTTRIRLTALVLNVVLNLALIPSHGALGAALATLLSEICFLALLLRACGRETGRRDRLLRSILVPLLAVLMILGPAFRGPGSLCVLALAPVLLLGIVFLVGRSSLLASHRKRVLVLRFSAGNVGDDAILLALVHHLRQSHPESSILVATRRREEIASLGMRTIPFRGASPLGLVSLLFTLLRCRALVLAGGTNLREVDPEKEDLPSWRCLGSLPVGLAVALLCKVAGARLVLTGQGFRPCHRPLGRLLLGATLKLATKVSVRDSTSREEALSLGRRDVVLGTDLAFGLPLDVARGVRDEPGKRSEARIGLAFRPAFRGEERERFILAFAHGLAGALEDAPPLDLLVLSRQPENLLEDDGSAARSLLLRLPSSLSRNARLHEEDLSPGRAIDLLRQCSLVVSTRLHGCILSVLAGTPVLGIAYDQKVSSFLHDAGLGELCLEPRAILDPTTLRTTLQRLRDPEVQASLRARIETARDGLRTRAREDLARLDDAILGRDDGGARPCS